MISTGAMDESKVLDTIRRSLAESQAKNPAFSMRSMAKRLGIGPGVLSQLISGKRPLSRKMASKLASALSIAPDELQGPHSGMGTRTGELLLSGDQFRMVSDWHVLATLSLAELHEFDSSPAWIASRLGISIREATAAIESLVRLNLLAPGKQKSGRLGLVPTGHQVVTPQDIPSSAIKKNHAQGLELAKDALHTVEVELREFYAAVFAADLTQLAKAKTRIRQMGREIMAMLETPHATEVYRLSVQLFPLSKNPISSKGNQS